MNGEKKGYTQSSFAYKLEFLHQHNIWENNPEIIKPKDAFKIAKVLEVSIDEIIF